MGYEHRHFYMDELIGNSFSRNTQKSDNARQMNHLQVCKSTSSRIPSSSYDIRVSNQRKPSSLRWSNEKWRAFYWNVNPILPRNVCAFTPPPRNNTSRAANPISQLTVFQARRSRKSRHVYTREFYVLVAGSLLRLGSRVGNRRIFHKLFHDRSLRWCASRRCSRRELYYCAFRAKFRGTGYTSRIEEVVHPRRGEEKVFDAGSVMTLRVYTASEMCEWRRVKCVQRQDESYCEDCKSFEAFLRLKFLCARDG